ncbi:uncharacterized protein sgo2 [Lampris incognitus]|uniref:uncharacterized protein sgo2 n=1 Tax=Lampris incognitus TaxID=2546036 RepID=UPI0024B4CE33|nr:uncharacterized protein sgo2 [Lampris incognitus]
MENSRLKPFEGNQCEAFCICMGMLKLGTLTMLKERKMTPSKASKQTFAVVSKIKNKMLNTSSFFKMNLKSNNRDLAFALQVEKEKNRQLVMEKVYLQKEVEAMLFERAIWRHKHEKLLLILDDLRSNTLHHLSRAADLLSSENDIPEATEYCGQSADKNDNNFQMERPPFQLTSQPECSREDIYLPTQKMMDLSEKNASHKFQSRLGKSTDFISDGMQEMAKPLGQDRLAAQKETPSLSTNPRVSDINSTPCPQNNQDCSDATSNTSDSSAIVVNQPRGLAMATEPEHHGGQEKTMLLNTEMEMTVSDGVSILTVEMEGKKAGNSDKPMRVKKAHTADAVGKTVREFKRNNKRGNVFRRAKNPEEANTIGSELTEIQNVHAVTPLQTDSLTENALTDTEVSEPHPPIGQNRIHITSRIPRFNKANACKQQKLMKDTSKSYDPAKTLAIPYQLNSNDIVLFEKDGCFIDCEVESSRAKEEQEKENSSA